MQHSRRYTLYHSWSYMICNILDQTYFASFKTIHFFYYSKPFTIRNIFRSDIFCIILDDTPFAIIQKHTIRIILDQTYLASFEPPTLHQIYISPFATWTTMHHIQHFRPEIFCIILAKKHFHYSRPYTICNIYEQIFCNILDQTFWNIPDQTHFASL